MLGKFTKKKNETLMLSDVDGADIIELILSKVNEGKVSIREGSINVGSLSVSTEVFTPEEIQKISDAVAAREAALLQKERKQMLLNICLELGKA